MSEQANQFKLGLFVVVSVVILMVGLIMLGAGAFLKSVRHAETYFEQSVGGLDVGAPIKFRGVTVGRVSKVGFATDRYAEAAEVKLSQRGAILVEMEFPAVGRVFSGNIEKIIPEAVEQGLRVRPGQSGIVGQSFLELVFVADPKNPAPFKPTWTPQNPFIPATESTMQMITTAAERIAAQLESVNFGQIFSRIDQAVGTLNDKMEKIDTVALSNEALKTLAEVRTASAKVNSILSSPDVDQAIKDLPAIAANIRSASKKVEDFLSSPQMEKAKNDIPEIAERIRSTAKRLDELLASPETRKIIDNVAVGSARFGAATEDLRSIARLVDLLLRQQYDDIQRIIAGLRRTIDNTSDLTEDAKRNPSRLIFGEPPPRINPKP